LVGGEVRRTEVVHVAGVRAQGEEEGTHGLRRHGPPGGHRAAGVLEEALGRVALHEVAGRQACALGDGDDRGLRRGAVRVDGARRRVDVGHRAEGLQVREGGIGGERHGLAPCCARMSTEMAFTPMTMAIAWPLTVRQVTAIKNSYCPPACAAPTLTLIEP